MYIKKRGETKLVKKKRDEKIIKKKRYVWNIFNGG